MALRPEDTDLFHKKHGPFAYLREARVIDYNFHCLWLPPYRFLSGLRQRTGCWFFAGLAFFGFAAGFGGTTLLL